MSAFIQPQFDPLLFTKRAFVPLWTLTGKPKVDPSAYVGTKYEDFKLYYGKEIDPMTTFNLQFDHYTTAKDAKETIHAKAFNIGLEVDFDMARSSQYDIQSQNIPTSWIKPANSDQPFAPQELNRIMTKNNPNLFSSNESIQTISYRHVTNNKEYVRLRLCVEPSSLYKVVTDDVAKLSCQVK